jgi:rRNA-processing protein EBP2
MGRKKLILEINNRSTDDESDDNSSFNGTDDELQEAFASGDLKTGLNSLVALRPIEQHINNRNGIKDKLNQIKLNYDWVERLDLVNVATNVSQDLVQQYGDINIKVNKKGQISGEELINSDKSDHDFKREMLFYRQAQSCVLEAIPKLHKLRIITKRPDDYFAEMAKTDDHMKKVRENLIHRQTAIEASEKAKKLRELRKYGKKIQQEVMIKRQKDKREMMDKLKKFKKGREENLDFLDNNHNVNDNKGKAKKSMTKQNQKQKYKQSKYGFGGQKKRSKYNTAESSAEMNKFSRKRNAKPTNKKQRPGKSKRQKIKNKRK